MIPFKLLAPLFHTFGSLIYPKVVKHELCKFLKPLHVKAKVLDLGAGTGVLSKFAFTCNENFHIIALDPEEGMLKYTPPYVEKLIGVAEALPFEDNSMDAIIIGEALHHFRDPHKAIKEIKRVLKTQGRLFIYEFDVESFLGKTICNTEKLLGEPGHFYAPEVLKKILEDYSFSVQVNQHSWRYTLSCEFQN